MNRDRRRLPEDDTENTEACPGCLSAALRPIGPQQPGENVMKASKRKAIEKHGWKVGSTQDFLGLSDEESTIIELALAMAQSFPIARSKSR
jgi:hypothetical protein